ncbi:MULTISPECIES: CesT family type III secretion system chaperone [unclassified Zunongwangia]|uniref:CesT family type III secretion system chaperone n=1 Tax=unclassified Zunongwangia TaxID=2632541 RepID=UPI0022DE2573|nr:MULTISPECIES: CesT family type III secretion system chaperone [unclassified Zunongwangia]WBL20917.1 CesT family type III secretion system chaperone [Zunongwangia sp. HRR-M8]WBL27204.1 CesT family type III secretion system chaperone [Zunongwangia sp. HGR-M22]
MKNHYQITKNFLLELNFDIEFENESEGILMIQKESFGIKNLILGVAPPILIMEQFLFRINNQSEKIFRSLLQKNRDIIHGAFVLDDSGEKVIFRDTLQIENLDLNELEGSLNSLSLLMSEYSEKIIEFSKY